MADELATLDATDQAALVRAGKVSARELVDAAIARIERLNPALNAVVIPLFEQARARAAAAGHDAAPFRGVPFLLKDLGARNAGEPYHNGMRFLRGLGWVEARGTHLAERFRAAGLVSLGKTNTPELGTMTTTEPVAYGPSRNPWDPARSTGGSSGGSAAAVASGMVPLAHANDGGGSIRIPASECGLVGLKPSRGRTSLGPESGELWAGLVVEHVVTRSVRDTAAVLDAVAGPMPGDPYVAPPPDRPFAAEVGAAPGRLRIGLMARAPGGAATVHADCAAAVADAGRLLESLGHVVEESHPAALDEHEFLQFFGEVVASWVAWELDDWGVRTGRPLGPDDVEPVNRALAEMGRGLAASRYIAAVRWLQAHTRRVAAWWAGGFDLLLTPTLAEPPPPLGEFSSPDDPWRGYVRSVPFAIFTSPFNTTGQPAISLPLFWNDRGLPIGLQLVAAYGREDLLLRIAAQLEAARPWAGRRPRVFA
jgi:amidase